MGLAMVSPPYFVCDFSRKMFLMLYSINWPNFIVWLSLLLDILGNICIAIVWCPGCDVISFEINLFFLIKPFFYMTKNARQKFNISWEQKELLRRNIKHFSSYLKRLQLTSECAFNFAGRRGKEYVRDRLSVKNI